MVWGMLTYIRMVEDWKTVSQIIYYSRCFEIIQHPAMVLCVIYRENLSNTDFATKHTCLLGLRTVLT